MSRGINKVILIGNAGNDPESRFFPNGDAVANVSIATSESWRDKQTGQMQERTEWHRLSFVDRGNYKLGQIASQYIKKGSKVYVEGSLRTREYEKDGIKRYTTEIIVDQLQLLDPRDDSQQQLQQNNWAGQQPQMPPPQPQTFGSWGNPQQPAQAQPQAGNWGQQPAPQTPVQQPAPQAPMQQTMPQESLDGLSLAPKYAGGNNTVQNAVRSAGSVEQALIKGYVVRQASSVPDFDDDIPF